MKVTQHVTDRLRERVGMDQADAEAFVESAFERGIRPSSFPPASEIRCFLESKRRGGEVVVHMGVVVVFGPDSSAVTAYPLPAELLEEYRKETKQHD